MKGSVNTTQVRIVSIVAESQEGTMNIGQFYLNQGTMVYSQSQQSMI